MAPEKRSHRFKKTQRTYTLTAKEIRFCALIFEGQSATNAYLKVFAKPDTQRTSAAVSAHRMLKRFEIRKCLRKMSHDAFECQQVTNNRIVAGLAAIAFADFRCLFDAEGTMLPPNRWPEDLGLAVEYYNFEEGINEQEGDRYRCLMKAKVKLASRLAALLVLARVYRLIGTGSDVTMADSDQPLVIVRGDVSDEADD